MKFAVILLILGCGCAAKQPHKRRVVFQNVHGAVVGTCDVDDKRSHWDANGSYVVVCK